MSVVPSITGPVLLCVMIAGIGAMLDPTWMFIAVERAWQRRYAWSSPGAWPWRRFWWW